MLPRMTVGGSAPRRGYQECSSCPGGWAPLSRSTGSFSGDPATSAEDSADGSALTWSRGFLPLLYGVRTNHSPQGLVGLSSRYGCVTAVTLRALGRFSSSKLFRSRARPCICQFRRTGSSNYRRCFPQKDDCDCVSPQSVNLQSKEASPFLTGPLTLEPPTGIAFRRGYNNNNYPFCHIIWSYFDQI